MIKNRLYYLNDRVVLRYIGSVIDVHTYKKDYDFEVAYNVDPASGDGWAVGRKITLDQGVALQLTIVPKNSPINVLYGPRGPDGK